MPTPRRAICVVALTLAACPAVPSVDPDPTDTYASWDAEVPEPPEPPGFDDCETASDCATRPNSVSLCDHQSCVLDCFPGFSNCDRDTDNGCEQSLANIAHCGACDVACAFPQAIPACPTGQCIIGECDKTHGGFGNCDGDPDNGCETPLDTEADCGGCDVPCALPHAEPTCAEEGHRGECRVDTCHPGFGDCDDAPENGCEAEVQTRLRCGACDATCEPGLSCAAYLQATGSEEEVAAPGFRCSPLAGDVVSLPLPAVAVAIAPDGAAYAALTASESLLWGEESLEIAGPSDAVLLRLAPDGVPGWTQTIGGLNVDTARAVTVGPDGEVTLAGTYQSGAKLGGALLPTIGGADVFVVRYDPTGTQSWGLGTGGPGDDIPTAMAADTDGAVVVVGTTVPPASFGGDVLTGQPDVAIGFVARYAAQGTPDWSVAISSQVEVTVVDVAIGAHGAVHVLMSADAPLQVDGVDISAAGHAVLTWTVDGDEVTAQSVPLETVRALAVTPSGVVFVVGGGELVRLGEETSPTFDLDGVTDLAAGLDGRLHVTGHTEGAFDVGLGPVVVDGVFAASYDATTGAAVWFVALDDASAHPQIAATGASVLIAGEAITSLDE